MWTMAVSCSISNRCGLTRRISSWSATTVEKATWDGEKWISGGMAVPATREAGRPPLPYDVRQLNQVGKEHVGPRRRLFQLLRRRLERRLVAGEQGRPHPQPLGRGDVLAPPRAAAQPLPLR